jgi:hypothetical protein
MREGWGFMRVWMIGGVPACAPARVTGCVPPKWSRVRVRVAAPCAWQACERVGYGALRALVHCVRGARCLRAHRAATDHLCFGLTQISSFVHHQLTVLAWSSLLFLSSLFNRSLIWVLESWVPAGFAVACFGA